MAGPRRESVWQTCHRCTAVAADVDVECLVMRLQILAAA
jgi:hypothetical protein